MRYHDESEDDFIDDEEEEGEGQGRRGKKRRMRREGARKSERSKKQASGVGGACICVGWVGVGGCIGRREAQGIPCTWQADSGLPSGVRCSIPTWLWRLVWAGLRRAARVGCWEHKMPSQASLDTTRNVTAGYWGRWPCADALSVSTTAAHQECALPISRFPPSPPYGHFVLRGPV